MTITLSRTWAEPRILRTLLLHPHLQDVDSAFRDDPVYVMRADGNTIAGYAVIRRGKHADKLKSLFTYPAFRGQGVASALVKAVKTDADRPLYLTCKEYMVEFYRKRGFRMMTKTPPWLRLRLWFCNAVLSSVYNHRWFAMSVVPKRRRFSGVTSRRSFSLRARRLKTSR